jgi:hypothetical protein
MIFKGLKFRYSSKIVFMDGVPGTRTAEGYVRFGRAIPQGKPVPRAAEQTKWTWSDGSPLFAVEIPCQGYSLTNMMYGRDGRVYLMKDGRGFVASSNQLKARANSI